MLTQPVSPFSERAHCQKTSLTLPSPSSNIATTVAPTSGSSAESVTNALLLHVNELDFNAGGDVDKVVGVAICISTVMQGDLDEEWARYNSCLKVQRLERSQLPAGCVDFEE